MITRQIIQRWLGFGDVVIKVYHIYEIQKTVYFRGRILREDNVISRPTDGWLRNLWNMLKRLASDESPHVELSLKLDKVVHHFKADQEGFFEACVEVEEEGIGTGELTLEAIQWPKKQKTKLRIKADIDQFSPQATYGVISDIDDTILQTGVVSRFKWRLIFNTMFVNPARRKTFPRTAGVFKKFATPYNPIFYISNSPWNMHDYLQEYLAYQDFPGGILLLRDIDWFKWKSKQLQLQNKYQEIVKVLEAHQELLFVLVGDAGEVDVDIYEQIARKFPNRINVIYIRSVKDEKRMKRVRRFVENVSQVPIIIFDHSIEMASHAESMGLIGKGRQER